jgi:hypothetical protein
VGYLEQLRAQPREPLREPPRAGGRPGAESWAGHIGAPAPRGEAAPDADRCAAPGCRAPIDRFGADGVGRCARHAPRDTVRLAPPDSVVNERPYEENEEYEERGAPAAPPAPSAPIVQGRAYEENEEYEERSVLADACPRCARLDEAARQVLAQLSTHPALPLALRALSPERLGILVKWAIVGLTNPRPQWPPPRPTDAQRTHRPDLDDIIVGLGGRGDDLPFEGIENEAEAEDWLFLDDDDDADVH